MICVYLYVYIYIYDIPNFSMSSITSPRGQGPCQADGWSSIHGDLTGAERWTTLDPDPVPSAAKEIEVPQYDGALHVGGHSRSQWTAPKDLQA